MFQSFHFGYQLPSNCIYREHKRRKGAAEDFSLTHGSVETENQIMDVKRAPVNVC